MAGSGSTYLKNELLDHVFNGSAWSRPATLYCALFTVAPTDDGGGTEVSGGSYQRTAMNTWSAASSKATTTGADCTFPTATVAWGDICAMALFDQQAVGGNMIAWCTLSTTKTVGVGDTFKVASGDFDVSFT